jgi:hypothetical protein
MIIGSTEDETIESTEHKRAVFEQYMHNEVRGFTKKMFDLAQTVECARVSDMVKPFTVALAGAIALQVDANRKQYEANKATAIADLTDLSDSIFTALETAIANSAGGVSN